MTAAVVVVVIAVVLIIALTSGGSCTLPNISPSEVWTNSITCPVNQSIDDGDSCTAECAENYSKFSGSGTYTCGANGTLSTPTSPLVCRKGILQGVTDWTIAK